eukprot:gene692-2126_t
MYSNIGAEVMGLRPRLLTPKAIYEKTETDFQEIMRYRDDWPEGDDRRDIIPIYSIREARKAEEKDEDEVKESESDSDSSNPPGYGTKASVAQEGDLAQDLESTTPQDLSAPPPSQPARAELTAPLADVSSQLDEATGGGLAPVKMVKLRRKSMFSKKHSKGSTSGKTKSRPALSARYLRHTALSLARSRRMDSESLEALESPADSFAVSPAEPSSSSPPWEQAPSPFLTAPATAHRPIPPQGPDKYLEKPLTLIGTVVDPHSDLQLRDKGASPPFPTSLRSAQHSPQTKIKQEAFGLTIQRHAQGQPHRTLLLLRPVHLSQEAFHPAIRHHAQDQTHQPALSYMTQLLNGRGGTLVGFDSTSSAPGASSQLEPRLSAGTSSQLESPPNFHTQVGRSRLSSAPGTASQLESSLNSCLDPPNPILLRGLHPTSAQPSPRTPNPPRRPGPPPASAAVPVGGGGGRGGGLGVRHVASARATGSPVVGLSLDQVAEDEEELLALQSTSTPSPKPGRIWSAQAIRTSLPDSTLQAADRPGYQEPANRPGYQQPTGTVGADRPGYMQPTSKARPQSGRMMRDQAKQGPVGIGKGESARYATSSGYKSAHNADTPLTLPPCMCAGGALPSPPHRKRGAESSIGHPGIESAMYATSGNKSALNTGTPLTLDASYAKMGISSTASKITSLRQDAENARLPMRSRRHSSGTFWN